MVPVVEAGLEAKKRLSRGRIQYNTVFSLSGDSAPAVSRLVEAFPDAFLRVRLDRGFATPEVLDFLDQQPRLEYVVNMASDAVLKRRAESAMRTARRLSKQSGILQKQMILATV